MDGTGTFGSCPNCGNVGKGQKIHRCGHCQGVFCEACTDHLRAWDGSDHCPKCTKSLITPIGDRLYQVLGAIG